MSIDLRPLKLGEILDRAFTLYRQHLATFIGILAPPTVMQLLISLPMQLIQPEQLTPDQPPDLSVLMPYLAAMAGGAVLIVLVTLGAQMLALGAATLGVADLHMGRVPTIQNTYGRVKSRLGRLLLLWLAMIVRFIGAMLACAIVGALPLVLLLVVQADAARLVAGVLGAFGLFLGFLGGFIFAFYLMMRYTVAAPSLVIEGLGVNAALARSRFLTTGHLWRVLGLTVFGIVISLAAMTVFQLPFLVATTMAGPESTAGFWLQIGGVVFGSIGSMLVTPIVVIASVVLYYDLRVRKEAFDLQVLMDALDGGAGTPGSTPGLYSPPPQPGLPG